MQQIGITIDTAPAIGTPSRARVNLAAAVFLYVALLMNLLSMLGEVRAAEYALLLLPGLAPLLTLRRAKRAAAASAVLALCLLIPANADGVCRLLNRLFERSAALQSYEYDFFVTSARAWPVYTALATLSLCAGALCALALHVRTKVPAAVLVLATVLAQIYFGVFSADPWLVLCLCALSIALLPQRDAWSFALPLPVMAVCIALTLAFPAPQPMLTLLSETIRDTVDTHIEAFVAALQSGDGEAVTNQRPPEETQDGLLRSGPNAGDDQAARYEMHDDPTFAGAQAGMASPTMRSGIALLVVLLALSLIPLSRYLRRRKRARQMARLFETAPAATAVDAMFRDACVWIAAYGKPAPHTPFSAYEKALPQLCGDAYTAMLALWERTVYGADEPDASDRAAMRDFHAHTVRFIKAKCTRRTRLLIRLYLFPRAVTPTRKERKTH